MITFKKIDRRYNGGNVYQYMLSVNNSRNPIESIRTFNEVRQWCQDTWGPSYELHDAWAWSMPKSWAWNVSGDWRPVSIGDWPNWAWANDSKDEKRVIYLKTDKEYMLAKLRWE